MLQWAFNLQQIDFCCESRQDQWGHIEEYPWWVWYFLPLVHRRYARRSAKNMAHDFLNKLSMNFIVPNTYTWTLAQPASWEQTAIPPGARRDTNRWAGDVMLLDDFLGTWHVNNNTFFDESTHLLNEQALLADSSAKYNRPCVRSRRYSPSKTFRSSTCDVRRTTQNTHRPRPWHEQDGARYDYRSPTPRSQHIIPTRPYTLQYIRRIFVKQEWWVHGVLIKNIFWHQCKLKLILTCFHFTLIPELWYE